MEPLIYYPTFEPPSEIWLKFALLYFESFRPIVPHNRENQISDTFRRIQNETDLIHLYSPGYEEGFRAYLSATKEADKIIAEPYERSELFRRVNIVRKWRDRSSWNFLIYEEKFSMQWADYCTRNELGIRIANEGILMSEELAFLYMTYLAKEIAFTESAALVTDNNRFDNFTNYVRATTPLIDRRNRFAKGIINLLVPKNLAEIPFQKLIQFRNTNRGRIRAFNAELNNVQQKIGNGYTERDFIESYQNIYSEICKETLIQGIGIASIPFAMYMLIQNPLATSPEYTKEILGAIGMMLGGGYSLNKGLRDIKGKRYCKKYLTNLEGLI